MKRDFDSPAQVINFRERIGEESIRIQIGQILLEVNHQLTHYNITIGNWHGSFSENCHSTSEASDASDYIVPVVENSNLDSDNKYHIIKFDK